jgi:hypothetical protein
VNEPESQVEMERRLTRLIEGKNAEIRRLKVNLEIAQARIANMREGQSTMRRFMTKRWRLRG